VTATRRHPEAVPPYRQPRAGARGTRWCRWCWSAVTPPRRTWCSQECVHEYRLERDWNYIRSAVEKRDRGVCVLCGVDTAWLRNVILHLRAVEWWNEPAGLMLMGRAKLVRWRWLHYAVLGCCSSRDPWEADHIHARADGGRDHPDNLRTLCVPCHKERTRRWVAERARRRREEAA